MAWFSDNLLARLVLWRRDGEELGIDTLEAIWGRGDVHDETMYAQICEFTLKKVEKLEKTG